MMESVNESESELDIEVCFEDVYELGQPVSTGIGRSYESLHPDA